MKNIWILIPTLIWVMIIDYCCTGKKKVDETVAVDSVDNVIVRSSGNVMSFSRAVVIITGNDTSRYYPGDTVYINWEYDGKSITLPNLKTKLKCLNQNHEPK